jgi:hypothetical protein
MNAKQIYEQMEMIHNKDISNISNLDESFFNHPSVKNISKTNVYSLDLYHRDKHTFTTYQNIIFLGEFLSLPKSAQALLDIEDIVILLITEKTELIHLKIIHKTIMKVFEEQKKLKFEEPLEENDDDNDNYIIEPLPLPITPKENRRESLIHFICDMKQIQLIPYELRQNANALLTQGDQCEPPLIANTCNSNIFFRHLELNPTVESDDALLAKIPHNIMLKALSIAYKIDTNDIEHEEFYEPNADFIKALNPQYIEKIKQTLNIDVTENTGYRSFTTNILRVLKIQFEISESKTKIKNILSHI